MPDDAVQRRLHRPGWNLERLQKVRTNSDRHHDRHQDHFAIFPPVRFPRDRRELVKPRIQLFCVDLDLFMIALPQCRLQPAHIGLDLVRGRRIQYVAFVAQILLRVPKQQFAVFNITRRKHDR